MELRLKSAEKDPRTQSDNPPLGWRGDRGQAAASPQTKKQKVLQKNVLSVGQEESFQDLYSIPQPGSSTNALKETLNHSANMRRLANMERHMTEKISGENLTLNIREKAEWGDSGLQGQEQEKAKSYFQNSLQGQAQVWKKAKEEVKANMLRRGRDDIDKRYSCQIVNKVKIDNKF